MKNILVPFDGSKPARRALNYIVELRKEGFGRGDVHLLNVQPAPKLLGDYASHALMETLNSEAMRYGAAINAEGEKTLAESGVDCQCHEVVGEISTAVMAAVDQYNCDAIIMGTRGMNNLANLMMGSVATRVVHEARVPVVLVK